MTPNAVRLPRWDSVVDSFAEGRAERSAVSITHVLPVAAAAALGGVVLPQPWRFLAGAATLLIVPGVPLAYLIHGVTQIGAADILPLGFAYTLVVMTALTIGGMLGHLDAASALTLLAAWSVTAWAVAVWRTPRSMASPWRWRFGPALVWDILLAAAFLRVGVALFHVGGSVTFMVGDPRGEEAMHLGMIRQLAEARWSVGGIFYRADTIYTSIFVPYHVMLALISRYTGTDPLLAYIYVRPVMAGLTLASLSGALLYLTRSATLVRIALTAWIAMMASGWGSQPLGQDYFWGLLAPVAHASDFGLGVVVPMGVFLAARLVRTERRVVAETLGTLLILLAVMVIRPRDASHITSYLLVAMIVAFAVRPSPFHAIRYRFAAVAFPIALIGLGWSAFVKHELEHIVAYEDSAKILLWRSLQALGGWDANPGSGKLALVRSWLPVMFDGLVTNLTLLGNPYVYLGVALIPFWILVARRMVLLWFILPPLLAWLIVIRFQMLIYAINMLTLSVAAVNPVRFIFHFSLILVALAVGWLVFAAGRIAALARPLGAGVAACLQAAIAFAFGVALIRAVVPVLRVTFYAHPTAYFSWMFVGGLAALVLRRRVPAAGARVDGIVEEFEAAMVPSWGNLGAAVAIGLMLVTYPAPSTPFTIAATRPAFPQWTLESWYRANALDRVVPWEIVDAVRRDFRTETIVAADVRYQPLFAALTPNHIPSIGTKLSTELDFYRTSMRLLGRDDPSLDDPVGTFASMEGPFYDLMRSKAMVFNERAPAELGRRYLVAFRVEALIVEPSRHARMVEIVRNSPRGFTLVTSSRGYDLYRVNLPQLAAEVESAGGLFPKRAAS